MFEIKIPTSAGEYKITAKLGETLVFLGPNGSGKSRLGVMVESTQLAVHRVGAHRALVLNTKVQPPNFEAALNRLSHGHEDHLGNRMVFRWQNKPAIALLSDFDHVVAALYAEENEISVQHRRAHLKDLTIAPPQTKLDRLKAIWDSLLPHRELVVLSGNIKVKSFGSSSNDYDAADLSDGERATFYMLGQALLARKNTIIVIDEPELHINRSILPKLWDALEAARSDCVFAYLTHDVEFATTRTLARKFAINSYENGTRGEQWELEEIPSDTGIPDDITTRIVGSRLPVLFTEGDGGSLDVAIYRAVYRDFTVIPIGSCDSVIHAVASMEQQKAFHRLGCAGLIDADGRDDQLIAHLRAKNIHALAVAEVENVLLLPSPFKELARLAHFDDADAEKRLDELKQVVLKLAASDAEKYALSATKRKIDRSLKRVGLKAKDSTALVTEYGAAVAAVDPAKIYAKLLADFQEHVAKSEYERIIALYDNKGLLDVAAQTLGIKSRTALQDLVLRTMNTEKGGTLVDAVSTQLPSIEPKRSIGILAYGSLIDEPGAELESIITRRMSVGISTPFPVEFARSSISRGGAPTLVPFEQGERVKGAILVLRDDVTLAQGRDMLWRRETRNASGAYSAPTTPNVNDIVIKELEQFHGVGKVLYTSIGSNIGTLTAEHLADLAIQSAEAVSRGELERGRDGVTYLHNAITAGIATRLSAEYAAAILRKTGTGDLAAAIGKLVRPENVRESA
ncbi:DUF4435 domain-containing protein [Mesorhizobium dulcispinae]|uniref:DUF4435 domain-containing protein n=1 Tax=Mesorhizobium dulcispinae TaxID=3072316 RepID=UPI002A24C8F5|nr:DUF4435 domain-containing protein [Mesorhizobium sp. VK23D]MDX8522673.1 AAA family ATPase [Mesorhizobium sp. VK23D]